MRSRLVVLPVLLTLQASLLQLERHARAAAAHGNDDGNDAMVDDGLHAHLAKLEEQHGGVPVGDGGVPLARAGGPQTEPASR